MSRRAGLKTLRHAWQDPDYRPKPKAPKDYGTPKTPEQLAADDQRIADFLEKSGCNRPALNKIIDREARVSVEGDTDLNHDNIEAAE